MKSISGLSLFESLIVISLISILCTMGLLNYSTVFFHLKTELALQEMVRSLNFSRAYAIQSAQEIKFCLTEGQQTCTKKPSKSYMIFTHNENGSIRIIKQKQLTIPLLIEWYGPATTDYISFMPDGFCQQNGHFTFMLAKSGHKLEKSLLISQSGRVRFN